MQTQKKYKNAIKLKYKNSLRTSEKKEYYKIKNLVKNTPFKLHQIHQRRGALRTPPNI